MPVVLVTETRSELAETFVVNGPAPWCLPSGNSLSLNGCPGAADVLKM